MKMFSTATLIASLALLTKPVLAQQQDNWGHYTTGNAQVEFLRPGRNVKLLRDFGYVDPAGQNWLAPRGTISDGASIPQLVWSVIGGPLDDSYRDAALLHDVGCCERTHSWWDVDTMFYNAMRCSGIDAVLAGTMFFAVVAKGPHWDQLAPKRPDDCFDTTNYRHVNESLATAIWRRLSSANPSRRDREILSMMASVARTQPGSEEAFRDLYAMQTANKILKAASSPNWMRRKITTSSTPPWRAWINVLSKAAENNTGRKMRFAGS
jgi:hypothetical protein